MTDDVEASYGPRDAQPIEQMLRLARAEGWDFFKQRMGVDPNDRASTPEADKMALIQADFRKVFATIEGHRVLEHLADITVRRPLWFLGVPPEYCHMREGQNALFFTILKILATAREENPPVREGHTNVGS